MNAYRDTDDEDEWDDAEDDGVAAEDATDEPTVPCPYCRREIMEDSPRCPYCERYVSAEDRPPLGHPLWILVTAVLCLGVAIWWVVRA